MRPTTAILLFSRSAAAEAVAKPLLGRSAQAQRLAQRMVAVAHSTAEKTGLPVFVVSEAHQRGTSFGERFYNAFNDVFQQGFEAVMAIGNDCLSLDAVLLKRAACQLERGSDVVLGEATDGGVYLMGLTQKSFQNIDFQSIKWQTSAVFSDLQVQILGSGLTISYLQVLSDVDTPADLKRVSLGLPRSWQLFLRGLCVPPPQYVRPEGCFSARSLMLTSVSRRAP